MCPDRAPTARHGMRRLGLAAFRDQPSHEMRPRRAGAGGRATWRRMRVRAQRHGRRRAGLGCRRTRIELTHLSGPIGPERCVSSMRARPACRNSSMVRSALVFRLPCAPYLFWGEGCRRSDVQLSYTADGSRALPRVSTAKCLWVSTYRRRRCSRDFARTSSDAELRDFGLSR